MASVVRVGIARLLGTNQRSLLSINVLDANCTRCISSKATRQEQPIQKPAPWPYKTRRFTLFHRLIDTTSARFDDNTKVIVVEGPVAAGKSKFAKAIAEELEMQYFPEAHQDMYLINDRGFNYKRLDDQLPEGARSFDVDKFLQNPTYYRAACMQFEQYYVKYSQYIDALAHLLSTGQGVVLDRCVFSDFVFLEAMFSKCYVSKAARKGYYQLRDNGISELLRPHLVIYLDVPVDRVLENIKKRAICYEKNSPVLTEDYLKCMEHYYKQKYLKEMSKHAELLVYDWSEEGDMDVVIEDIERIDFDNYDQLSSKFKDWNIAYEEDWAELRYKYADNKNKTMLYAEIPLIELPEVCLEPEDAAALDAAKEAAPGGAYVKGYDPTMGDKGYWFKMGLPFRRTLPLIERQLPSK